MQHNSYTPQSFLYSIAIFTSSEAIILKYKSEKKLRYLSGSPSTDQVNSIHEI